MRPGRSTLAELSMRCPWFTVSSSFKNNPCSVPTHTASATHCDALVVWSRVFNHLFCKKCFLVQYIYVSKGWPSDVLFSEQIYFRWDMYYYLLWMCSMWGQIILGEKGHISSSYSISVLLHGRIKAGRRWPTMMRVTMPWWGTLTQRMSAKRVIPSR